jgi:peptidoglycan/xylan/chitin deacetylase (PgdA/CDA1 family)
VATLTFDDGPDPSWTPHVLRELGTAGVRATFFVMAARARSFPELVARTAAEGHEVQLHCLDHVRHTETSRERIESDTDSALSLLEPLVARPHRWRPPWGACAGWTSAVAAARGLRLAGWTLDTQDWSGLSAQTMLRRGAPAATPDSVVLLHDGLGPGARRDGCGETAALIAPLTECFRALGATLEPLGDRPVALP